MLRKIFPPSHIVHLLFKECGRGRSLGGGGLLRLYLLIALEQAVGEPWQGWHMVPGQFTHGQRRGAVSGAKDHSLVVNQQKV